MLDAGVLVETLETATFWSGAEGLHADGGRRAAREPGGGRPGAVPRVARLRDRVLALLHRGRPAGRGPPGPVAGREGARPPTRSSRPGRPSPTTTPSGPTTSPGWPARSGPWGSRCCGGSRPRWTPPASSTRGCSSREVITTGSQPGPGSGAAAHPYPGCETCGLLGLAPHDLCGARALRAGSSSERTLMPHTSTRRRAAIAVSAAGLVLGAAATGPAYAAPSQPGEPGAGDPPKTSSARSLGAHDEALLADAESTGDRRVTLLVSTDQGQAKNVAARLDGLGGTVTRRFDKVGFMVVSVPTSKVARRREAPGRQRRRPRRVACRCPTRARATPADAGRGGGRRRRRPRDGHARRQPVHADRRDRRGRLQAGAPDLRRSRRDDRRPGLRRRPRPPGAAPDDDRRAQDRRLGDRDRPAARRRPDLATDAHGGHRPGRSTTGQTCARRRPGRTSFNRFCESDHRGERAPRRRQPRR